MFRLIVVALSVFCLASARPEGEYDDRIVNGRAANINEYYWQVSIQQYKQHFCGGTIIAPTWILSASHCTEDIIKEGKEHTCQVRAGSSNWSSGGVTKDVAKMINHPKYDTKTVQYDVALIKLVAALIWSASIKPATIINHPLANGAPVEVSGWGQLAEDNQLLPQYLQAVLVNFLPREACMKQPYRYGQQIMDGMVCAVGEDKDSCQGDSGGPLVASNGVACLVGVVSWGAGCAQKNLPGVYCDMTNSLVKSFIQTHCPEAKFANCA
ncbi:trypsin delta-like [Episyrphus balteatus]|uniref:trypsin delta-like n=1 Tax=Episyrphus balteatus TaxID=286459 RepID=UPI0024850493|nr:trypsin delta-like [Episyrphus balteatus]